MEKFILTPSIDLYPGVRVSEDTELEYKTENIEQTVKGLVFRSIARVSGEGYESVIDSTIQLKPGDILIFEEGGRGYVKPVENFVTVTEAIEELKCIESMR